MNKLGKIILSPGNGGGRITMNKWNLKKRISVFLAFVFLIMSTVPAAAEEIPVSPDDPFSGGISDGAEDSGDVPQEISVTSYDLSERLKAYEGNPVSRNVVGDDYDYTWWVDDYTLTISINEPNPTVEDVYGELKQKNAQLAKEIESIQFYNPKGYHYLFGSNAFGRNDNGKIEGFESLRQLIIRKEVTAIGGGAFKGCTSLVSFSVESGGSFAVEGSALYDINKTKLIAVPAGYSEQLLISDGITEICDYAALGCKIKKELFIPKNVETIGNGAFRDCRNLTSIYIGSSSKGERLDEANASKIKTIKSGAFAACTSVKRVFLPCTVNSVASDAFEEDQLEYLAFYAPKKNDPQYDTEAKIRTKYVTLGIELVAPEYGVVILKYSEVVVALYPNGGYWGSEPGATGVSACVASSNGTLFKDLNIPEPTPAKTGLQNFYKWKNDTTKQLMEDDDPVNVDMDLYACYSGTFDITFKYLDSNAEEKTEVLKIASSTIIDKNKVPDVEGIKLKDRQFRYWRSKLYGGPITMDELCSRDGYGAVYQSDTITAIYTEIYTVNFYSIKRDDPLLTRSVSQDSSISDLDDIIEKNTGVKKSLEEDFPASNYSFRGWYNKPSEGKKWTKNKRVQDNLDLYARYDHFVTIKFDYMEKEYVERYGIDPNPESKQVMVGNTYTMPLINDFPGYTFGGWYSDRSFSEESKVYKTTLTAVEDITYYAKWTKKHTVSFCVSDDNNEYQVYATRYVTDGETLYENLPPDPPEKGEAENAYSFVRWNTQKDGKGANIDEETVVKSDITCYAIYEQGHVVRFHSDDNPIIRRLIKHGKPLGDPPEVEKLGYILLNWNRAEDGSGEIVDRNTLIYESMDVYAIWYDDPDIPNDPQHTISFNSMGGSEVPAQTVSEGFLAAKPEDPTWADHKFQGWYTDTDYSKQWDFEKDTVMEDMYLYARWITWTEEDEDRQNGIYWVRLLRNGKASLSEYFQESGLKYSYDKSIVKFSKGKRVVKGKKLGETRITATKVDGSEYPVSVRVFVLKQELQDMFAYTAGQQLDANEALTVSGFPPDKWASSNPGVASINSKTGIITVRKRGKAKIKAYYNNKVVTATFRSEVPKFAKAFYRLKTGQKKKLKIKRLKKYDIVSWNVLPEGSLSVNSPSWNDIEKAAAEAYTKKGNTTSGNSTSGNRSISMNEVSTNEIMGIGSAEVDGNGKLTALTAGDVIVYAAVYGQIISTKVHIEPPVLRKKTLVMKINKTAKLKLSRTKLKNVEWKSTNDQVAYVDPLSGKIYALKKGRVTLRTHAGGVVNSCSVQVEDTGQMTKGPALSR